MTAEQFLHALALCESGDNPKALGDYDDEGMPHARGRWQIHADRKIDMARRYNLWPHLGESFDSWERRMMAAFFDEYQALKTPVEIAVRHHLGHWCDPIEDLEYAKHFLRYAASSMPQSQSG